jgi:hypothetical protein
MLALTIVCWGIFAFIIGLVNPEATNWLGFILFYSSLAASLIGSFAIIGFIVRFLFLKDEIIFNLVKISFRQSFLISLFIISLLILKSVDLFNWLNLILLAVIFTIIELVITSSEKNK